MFSKKIIIISIIMLLILVNIPSIIGEIDDDITPRTTSRGTHTVLGEFGTATWCGYCKYCHAALKNLYAGGWHDFIYVSLVTDVNTHSSARHAELGGGGYPGQRWDGGFIYDSGSYSDVPTDMNRYNGSIISCSNRAVADLDASLNVIWQGSATMGIQVSIQNNEASTYNGHLHVYVTEKVSSMGWLDTWGYPYTFPFLDYAFNQDISIGAGNIWENSVIWDGNTHTDGYGNYFDGITSDNIMIILSVFDGITDYVDEVATNGTPTFDIGPPEISNVGATPSCQALGGNIQISADVIDDSGVNEVKAIITDPDNSILNETMTLDTGDTYTYDTIHPTTGVYSFQIWTEDINGNQNTSNSYTFEIMNPHVTDLSSNWNFVSLNLNQTISKTSLIINYSGSDYSWDDAVTLGYINDIIFGWDRDGQYYTFADTLEPGNGYWVYAYEPCEIWISIMSTNIDNYMTNLKQNWNILGTSKDEMIDKTDIIINYNGFDYTWDDAVTLGYINDIMFGWDRPGQYYTFADTLEPGYAYWGFAYQNCLLRK